MYPAEDLKKLELRKLRAQLSILQHRQQCIVAGREIEATVEKLETWRERAAHWGGMLKFAPGLFGIWRAIRGMRKSAAPSPHQTEHEEPDHEATERPKKGKVSTMVNWLTVGLRVYNTFKGRR